MGLIFAVPGHIEAIRAGTKTQTRRPAKPGDEYRGWMPGKLPRVLRYLASQMRTAKRMLRDMAANAAWQSRGTNEDSDLATRIMDVLRGE